MNNKKERRKFVQENKNADTVMFMEEVWNKK